MRLKQTSRQVLPKDRVGGREGAPEADSQAPVKAEKKKKAKAEKKKKAKAASKKCAIF